MEDKRLLKALRSGDIDALRLIYEKYKDDLLTVAVSLLSDVHAAEDCLQDIFVGLAEKAPDLRIRKNLKGYLLSCIANRARDRLRKNARQPTEELGRLDYAVTQQSPAEQLDDCQQYAEICKAMAQLPYAQREVIALHTQGRMIFKKIAELQDESINTVQSRYRYGIEKLRTLLKKEHENE